MSKFEKNGRPTINTVGEKGDVYIDLDTGVRYDCLGTKGFIDVDSVDEPAEYKWNRMDADDLLTTGRILNTGHASFVEGSNTYIYVDKDLVASCVKARETNQAFPTVFFTRIESPSYNQCTEVHFDFGFYDIEAITYRVTIGGVMHKLYVFRSYEEAFNYHDR